MKIWAFVSLCFAAIYSGNLQNFDASTFLKLNSTRILPTSDGKFTLKADFNSTLTVFSTTKQSRRFILSDGKVFDFEMGTDRKILRESTLDDIVLIDHIFFEKREQFNPWSLLQNPMLLMSMATLAMVFLVPKMKDAMDPELIKEMEEKQKNNELPISMEVPDIAQQLSDYFSGSSTKTEPPTAAKAIEKGKSSKSKKESRKNK